MAFADRLVFARKQKKIKRADLGKMIGTSGDMIGKYECGENVLSIDIAAKIADVLLVTLDYLAKDGQYKQTDNDTLKRLKQVQELDAENRYYVFATIDAFIKTAKLKSIAIL